ncbi:MAG TPA: TIGR04282 family arsenosugar biosynthesis glycosyltransferase [bacterium]
MNAIVIFAKYPAPHRVKTRLGAQIGYEPAADLYRLFIEQTLAVARRSGVERIFLACDPKERQDDFRKMFAGEWTGFLQQGDDLGMRMDNAFQLAFSQGMQKVVIIGSDSPTLPTQHLTSAFEVLENHDIALGPAEDGGYYLIGLQTSHPQLFKDIEWSSASVLPATRERAKRLRLSCALLPTWYDVDEIGTLKRAANDDATGMIEKYLQNHTAISFD